MYVFRRGVTRNNMKYISGIHADLTNKTIVVLYLCYFGDMVSITPFLEVLRRAAKGSKIYLAVDSRFKESVAYNPNVDEILSIDRKEMGLADTWEMGKQMGQLQPDLLFVLHGTTRTTLMSLAMHPKTWAGEPGTRLDSFFMDWPLLIERKEYHVVDKFIRILEDIGVTDTRYDGMRIYTCDAWEQVALQFFERQGVKQGNLLAGFSVGSSTPEKNWPAEKYGKVADYFAEKGYRPVFFGVKSEMPLVEKVLSVMKHKKEAVIATGKLSMGEFIAASSWCQVAFTNDSGPMYVFDSREVPVISMFGPSNVKLYHPLGVKSCALATTDMPREQDHVNHTIRDKSYVPIENISTEEVIRAGEWALGMVESKRYKDHYVIVK